MIYLLYGENIHASRAVLGKFLDRFKKEAGPGWRVFNCEEDELDAGLGSVSLFASKDFYIFKYPSALSKEKSEMLMALLKRWSKDDSIVVFYERSEPEKNKFFKDIKKYATKTEEFKKASAAKLAPSLSKLDRAEQEKLRVWHEVDTGRFLSELEKVSLGGVASLPKKERSGNELFVLGDLWGKREKQKVYLLYHALLDAGFEADDMLRTLLWHVKNLNNASRGRTKEMKPFVAQKASEQARNFSDDALSDAYEKLTLMADPRGRDLLETKLLHFLLAY